MRDYVLAQPGTSEFLDELDRLFALLLPGYEREGKAYLSIGVGCTGGRHRSVVIAEQLARAVHAPRLPRRGAPPGRRPCPLTSSRASLRSAEGTVSRSRCAPCAGTRTTITAVVSVADDGGSSGRLRRDLGVPAPGDLRKCLVALAADDGPWPAAFEHRFRRASSPATRSATS